MHPYMHTSGATCAHIWSVGLEPSRYACIETQQCLCCRERWWAAVSVLFAFFTMLFCILLTIFDAFHHDNLHWGFAVVFFISLIICGIAYLVEIGREWQYSHFVARWLLCNEAHVGLFIQNASVWMLSAASLQRTVMPGGHRALPALA